MRCHAEGEVGLYGSTGVFRFSGSSGPPEVLLRKWWPCWLCSNDDWRCCCSRREDAGGAGLRSSGAGFLEEIRATPGGGVRVLQVSRRSSGLVLRFSGSEWSSSVTSGNKRLYIDDK